MMAHVKLVIMDFFYQPIVLVKKKSKCLTVCLLAFKHIRLLIMFNVILVQTDIPLMKIKLHALIVEFLTVKLVIKIMIALAQVIYVQLVIMDIS